MAGSQSTQTISSRERSLPAVDYEDKLSKWLFFSFLFHGALILALFVVPFFPSHSRPSYPDLYRGFSGRRKNRAATIWVRNWCLLRPPRQHRKRRRRKFLPHRCRKRKQETKKEKPKPVEKEAPQEEKVVLKEATKKERRRKSRPKTPRVNPRPKNRRWIGCGKD